MLICWITWTSWYTRQRLAFNATFGADTTIDNFSVGLNDISDGSRLNNVSKLTTATLGTMKLDFHMHCVPPSLLRLLRSHDYKRALAIQTASPVSSTRTIVLPK